MLKNFYIVTLVICLLSLSFSGCFRSKGPEGTIVATVNDHPIFSSEIEKALTLKRKINPKFKITPAVIDSELENLVSHRLLIDQAQKMGLDKRSTFVDTIKNFWEQALIKELVTAKNKEFSTNISVEASEIEEYYKNLAFQTTFKIIKRKNKDLLEKIIGTDESLIAWQEVVGPIGYLEIKSNVLRKAFNLNEGESQIYYDNNFYYLIFMAKKTPVALPDLSDIRGDITRRIMMNKQSTMLDDWLDNLRGKAVIDVDSHQLNNLAEVKN